MFFKDAAFVLQCSLRLCSRTIIVSLYTTRLSSLIHSHKLGQHLYANDTQVYISLYIVDTDLSLKELGDCLSDISGWMTNTKLWLNANKTDLIIIGTSRQRSKLFHFLVIASHHQTLYLMLVVHLIVILLSETLLLLSYSWPSPFSALYFSYSRHNHCYSTHY